MDYEQFSYEQLLKILKKKNEIIESLNTEIVKLQEIADMDCMTGVLNRRAGMKKLQESIKSISEVEDKLTICFVDVDKLKSVNDKYGHNEGDKLLVNVCDVMKTCIRKTDFVFRVGGDEFVVTFPNTNIEVAKNLCKKMVKTLQQENKILKYPYRISISYGLAECNDCKDICIEKLIKDADLEMYKRKFS